MDPQCHHPFEKRERRLDLDETCLDRPRAEPLGLDPFVDNDRAVLMPAQSPVARRRLVEQHRANGFRAFAQPEYRDPADHTRLRQQIGKPRRLADPHTGHLDRQAGKPSLDRAARLLIERAGKTSTSKLSAISACILKLLPRQIEPREIFAQPIGYLESDAFAGPYLADQLLLPFALAGDGVFTTVKPSQHSLTAADIIARFLGRQCRFEQMPSGAHRMEVR